MRPVGTTQDPSPETTLGTRILPPARGSEGHSEPPLPFWGSCCLTQDPCREHPLHMFPTRWLGEMATENTLIPKCLASLAASSRPPQGSLYPSKGCPSVTTIRYLFSL